jgi:hypothetical protein
MARFSFQRRTRTGSSEQYNIYDDDASEPHTAVGQVDLHYTVPGSAEATVILFEDFAAEDVEDILATLDEDVLNLAAPGAGHARAVVFFGQEYSLYELGGQDRDVEEMLDEEEDEPDETHRV